MGVFGYRHCVCTFILLRHSMNKYNHWLTHEGANASELCKEKVGRYFCMETFPPCRSATNYSIFPCREACEDLFFTCKEQTPESCPLDGPYVNSTEAGEGRSARSNNNLQSCFMADGSLQTYP